MDMSVLTLSRFQFALTIMFHYLFPPWMHFLPMCMVALGRPYVPVYTSVVYWAFRGKVQLGKFSY